MIYYILFIFFMMKILLFLYRRKRRYYYMSICAIYYIHYIRYDGAMRKPRAHMI